MIVLRTARLRVRHLHIEDAPFILQLVNERSWLRFIGDKGVRTLDDARDYLRNGPLAMYERFGYGLYLLELEADGSPIGMCGLLKRDTLPDADIGFALLPHFWGQGYAFEAAAAVLDFGRRRFDLQRVLAITSLDNDNSIRLLQKLGLQFERLLELVPGNTVKLFAIRF
jgi:[ribosomal protein S5]-alanine N-acetyltransferase